MNTTASKRRGALVAAVRACLSADNAVLVTALAVLVALAIAGLFVAASDSDVLHQWGRGPLAGLGATGRAVWSVYEALLTGAIVKPSAVSAAVNGTGQWGTVFYPVSQTLVAAAPLIFCGLAVVVPFRAGMFNIGAQGQFIGGAICGGYVGFAIALPPTIHIIAAFLAAFAAGAAVGGLAGWLRACTGAHEVITTIMLNYILLSVLTYILGTRTFEQPGSTAPLSPLVAKDAMLPHLGGGLQLHLGVGIAILTATFTAWFLRRTTVGFAFRTVGSNLDAARTAGINVNRIIILSLLIGGGLAGLAGANEVLGTQYALTSDISGNYGFYAITVALLARGRAWGVVWAALLFGALSAGGTQVQVATGTPVDIVTVIQALIVMFVAAPALLTTVFRIKTGKHTAVSTIPTLEHDTAEARR